MKFKVSRISCLALLMATALPLQAQTILPKPTFSKPTVLYGPAKLSAVATKGQVTLTFSPVENAQAYRVTRASTISDPVNGGEVTIYEGPAPGYFDPPPGGTCSASLGLQGYCQYVDTKVVRSIVYTYRVWAIYPGPALSNPSPSVNVLAR